MHTLLKTIFISFLTPVIALFLVDIFNPFEYVRFVNISVDTMYEFGITTYMTILGVAIKLIEDFLESKKAYIICTFYLKENDKDINNVPLIACDEQVGVATINCYLKLAGNLKRLRKCELELALPSWLDAQLNISDTVVDYVDKRLVWKFDGVLPESGIDEQIVKCKTKISLIKNDNVNDIYILLVPQIRKIYGVSFKTNGFKVQNGG